MTDFRATDSAGADMSITQAYDEASCRRTLALKHNLAFLATNISLVEYDIASHETTLKRLRTQRRKMVAKRLRLQKELGIA